GANPLAGIPLHHRARQEKLPYGDGQSGRGLGSRRSAVRCADPAITRVLQHRQGPDPVGDGHRLRDPAAGGCQCEPCGRAIERPGHRLIARVSDEPGSSIMPGKGNPTQAEALTMIVDPSKMVQPYVATET